MMNLAAITNTYQGLLSRASSDNYEYLVARIKEAESLAKTMARLKKLNNEAAKPYYEPTQLLQNFNRIMGELSDIAAGYRPIPQVATRTSKWDLPPAAMEHLQQTQSSAPGGDAPPSGTSSASASHPVDHAVKAAAAYAHMLNPNVPPPRSSISPSAGGFTGSDANKPRSVVLGEKMLGYGSQNTDSTSASLHKKRKFAENKEDSKGAQAAGTTSGHPKGAASDTSQVPVIELDDVPDTAVSHEHGSESAEAKKQRLEECKRAQRQSAAAANPGGDDMSQRLLSCCEICRVSFESQAALDVHLTKHAFPAPVTLSVLSPLELWRMDLHRDLYELALMPDARTVPLSHEHLNEESVTDAREGDEKMPSPDEDDAEVVAEFLRTSACDARSIQCRTFTGPLSKASSRALDSLKKKRKLKPIELQVRSEEQTLWEIFEEVDAYNDADYWASPVSPLPLRLAFNPCVSSGSLLFQSGCGDSNAICFTTMPSRFRAVDISDVCQLFGRVSGVKIVGRKGAKTVNAFVRFSSHLEAVNALQYLHHATLAGHEGPGHRCEVMMVHPSRVPGSQQQKEAAQQKEQPPAITPLLPFLPQTQSTDVVTIETPKPVDAAAAGNPRSTPTEEKRATSEPGVVAVAPPSTTRRSVEVENKTKGNSIAQRKEEVLDIDSAYASLMQDAAKIDASKLDILSATAQTSLGEPATKEVSCEAEKTPGSESDDCVIIESDDTSQAVKTEDAAAADPAPPPPSDAAAEPEVIKVCETPDRSLQDPCQEDEQGEAAKGTMVEGNQNDVEVKTLGKQNAEESKCHSDADSVHVGYQISASGDSDADAPRQNDNAGNVINENSPENEDEDDCVEEVQERRTTRSQARSEADKSCASPKPDLPGVVGARVQGETDDASGDGDADIKKSRAAVLQERVKSAMSKFMSK